MRVFGIRLDGTGILVPSKDYTLGGNSGRAIVRKDGRKHMSKKQRLKERGHKAKLQEAGKWRSTSV